MDSLGKFYDQYYEAIDLVIGALAVVVVVLFAESSAERGEWLSKLLDKNRPVIFGTIAQTAGALLGFILTAVSIILAFFAQDRFRVLMKSGYAISIYRVYWVAVVTLGLLTLFGFIALLVDSDASPLPILELVIWFLFVISSLRVGRCVWFLNMITQAAQKSG